MSDSCLPAPRRGFTLVELLVVIGILALLVGILIPTLSRAREQGFATACRSNLRQVIVGTMMYADANGQRLPAYLPHLSRRDADLVSTPQKTYRVGYATAAEGADDPNPANQGLLFTGDYLAAPDVYYCPTQQGRAWKVTDYERPWMTRATSGLTPDGAGEGTVFLVRSAYMLNPHVVDPNGLRAVRKYQRLTRVPAKAVMAMDLLIGSNFGTVAHDANTSWNLAFIDGHVETARSPFVAERTRPFPVLTWGTFEVFLRVLQDPSVRDELGP